MKNYLDRIDSILDTKEENISELEDTATETEMERKKKTFLEK